MPNRIHAANEYVTQQSIRSEMYSHVWSDAIMSLAHEAAQALFYESLVLQRQGVLGAPPGAKSMADTLERRYQGGELPIRMHSSFLRDSDLDTYKLSYTVPQPTWLPSLSSSPNAFYLAQTYFHPSPLAPRLL